MKIICMDCKRYLGKKAGGDGVSHGLCPECYLIRREEIEEMKRQDRYLEDSYENYLKKNNMA